MPLQTNVTSALNHDYQKEPDDLIQDIAEYEDIIRNFLAGNDKVSFDDDGCLLAKTTIRKGDMLSDLELKSALQLALSVLSDK